MPSKVGDRKGPPVSRQPMGHLSSQGGREFPGHFPGSLRISKTGSPEKLDNLALGSRVLAGSGRTASCFANDVHGPDFRCSPLQPAGHLRVAPKATGLRGPPGELPLPLLVLCLPPQPPGVDRSHRVCRGV